MSQPLGVTPSDRAPRRADGIGGRQIIVRLADALSGLQVEWRAILRDGSNYVQIGLALRAAQQPLEVKEVIFWELAAPNARVVGTVDGSPVIAETLFFGCEHPLAKSELLGTPAADQATRFRCRFPSQLLLRPGAPAGWTAVVGIVPPDQLRRGFLYYLERERAHPYRPLLHYNNGSEIGCEYWRRKVSKRDREAAEFRRNQEQVWLIKFDGFGAGNNQPGPGPYGSDVEALLRLMTELRELKPDVFFNPSTGTWPSPFWLKYADSIWRQGSDTSVLGKGSDRQRWITYRDSEIYHGVLDKSPLYPISSLMIHGVYVNALPLFGNPYDPAAPRPTYEPAEIVAEMRSFFGTGTNLQELYIEPQLMTPRTWDALAEAARWSRSNADVLADTHWVGGDPAKSQVYGWASWSKRKGILTLRNPDDRPAALAVDIGQALELPKDAARKYSLKSPWPEDAAQPPVSLTAGQPHTFTLQPFEVLVFDAIPVQP